MFKVMLDMNKLLQVKFISGKELEAVSYYYEVFIFFKFL